jgi:hypothetical protein
MCYSDGIGASKAFVLRFSPHLANPAKPAKPQVDLTFARDLAVVLFKALPSLAPRPLASCLVTVIYGLCILSQTHSSAKRE